MIHSESNLIKKLKYRNYEMYKYFEKALEILSVLNEKAYEAYIVGGAVRDLFLEIDFNDIDIATNATPQIIQSLFPDCDVDMQYEHLGSVVLKVDGFRYEITTFRNEEYVKHKLKSVHYSKKLVDDIQRRDFTINALAMSLNQNIIDVVNGQRDLKLKTVKIIGKGTKRFKEDPSRILRGLHLVSKLKFNLDIKTEHAMYKSRHLLAELSNYKLITLLNKILNEKYSFRAIRVMKFTNLFKDMPKYHEWIKIISKYKKLNYIEQFTILFRLLEDIPLNTGFSHKEIVEMKKLYELSFYMSTTEITPIDIIQIGLDNLLQADNIEKALNKEYVSQSKNIKLMNKTMPIHSARELKISVEEIKVLLNNDNSKISELTNELLMLVVTGAINNTYHELEEAALFIIEGKNKKYNAQDNYNPYVNQVEENERIIALLEQNKENSAKVGVVVDSKTDEENIKNIEEYINIYNDEINEQQNDNVEQLYEEINKVQNDMDQLNNIFENNDNIIENDVKESNEEVNNTYQNNDNELVQMFYEDFNELYYIYRKNVFDDMNISTLSETEIHRQESIMKEDVKRILVEKNPDYKNLNDRGLI